MLRAVPKKPVCCILKANVLVQSTRATPGPAHHVSSTPRKVGRKVMYIAGALATAAVGVIGYAYMNPEARQQVETAVPQAKQILDAILGSSRSFKSKQQFFASKEQTSTAASEEKTEETLSSLTKYNLPEPERKPLVHVDSVDMNVPLRTENINLDPENVAKRTKELETSLLSAIHSAETRVRDATDAKIKTIVAINDHAALFKATVNEPQNADWEKVASALQHAESLAHKDGLVEADGRSHIDSLRAIITDGKKDPATANNPLLLNATETANKLSHQLDELDGLVMKAREESTTSNQYRDLLERNRNQFEVDVTAKVREEQHIVRALADQHESDERIAAEHPRIELQRVKQQQDADVEKAVMQKHSSREAELEEQLKRTGAAHLAHLEQVIRTQRQLFAIEHNQKIEEVVRLERDHHSREVGAALSRLAGIESALNSRVALDSENRRAKQFWIACHSLIESIQHGIKAGEDMEKRRFPLEDSLRLLEQCEYKNAFVSALITAFPGVSKEEGVYTEQDLKNRFKKIYKLGWKTARIDDNGGTLAGYLWSYMKSLLLFDLPQKFSDDDMIDLGAMDNLEVLARAKWYVDHDELASAIRVSQLLHGELALATRGWLCDARAFLEARLLAQLLVAHAAVSSIRSTY